MGLANAGKTGATDICAGCSGGVPTVVVTISGALRSERPSTFHAATLMAYVELGVRHFGPLGSLG